jgi:hypothetical protein
MMTKSIVLTILVLGMLNFYQCAYAGKLGRLFTTPEERAALNAERSKPPIPLVTKIEKKPEPPPPPPPLYITFNGLVKRNNGTPVVWINESNELKQEGFTVELDKMTGITVPIFLSKAKRRIWLKPGQTINTLELDSFE